MIIKAMIERIKAENFENILSVIIMNQKHLNVKKIKENRRNDKMNHEPVISFAEEQIAR
nr:hypothetical protein GTC16762_08380 [Pigmentibacter ruber]